MHPRVRRHARVPREGGAVLPEPAARVRRPGSVVPVGAPAVRVPVRVEHVRPEVGDRAVVRPPEAANPEVPQLLPRPGDGSDGAAVDREVGRFL